MNPGGTVGSLSAFWPVIEPVLERLDARRVCEVGVDDGAFSQRLLEWCASRGCRYYGIDPAPQFAAASPGDVIVGRSLDVLPGLDACDAYFVDGDHNYYTVRAELAIVERVTRGGSAPAVFVHDVGWPWGRRDMYHCVGDIPAAHRHPHSETLGVAPDRDELIDGGLRAPGRYAIACAGGGARNGVLTAVEDFLASADARGWSMLLLPVAYGLAVLYQPDRLPAACRQHMSELQAASTSLAPLLRTLEANYVSLYLFGEDMKRYADGLKTYADGLRQHADGLDRHVAAQERHIAEHERAYQDLLAHANALQAEYEKLDAAYRTLQT